MPAEKMGSGAGALRFKKISQFYAMGLMSALRRVVHRSYFKLRGMKIGSGAAVHISTDVHHPSRVAIGENSTIYKHASIYPTAKGSFRMGKRSHTAPYAYFLIADNHLTLGDDVAIGPFCVFVCHSNAARSKGAIFSQNYEDGDIRIGNNVFIGAHCTFLPGTVIEDHVVVAAQSVVKGRLESHAIYGGAPARLLKRLDRE